MREGGEKKKSRGEIKAKQYGFRKIKLGKQKKVFKSKREIEVDKIERGKRY